MPCMWGTEKGQFGYVEQNSRGHLKNHWANIYNILYSF